MGAGGHELVRVYAVRFADDELYGRERFDCVEVDGPALTCEWKRISGLRGGDRLYPDGLLAMLTAAAPTTE